MHDTKNDDEVRLRVRLYVTDGEGNPVAEPDPIQWGLWMANADRVVARSVTMDPMGRRWMVSTVFLGVEHAPWPVSSGPVLWETLVSPYGTVEQKLMRRCGGNRVEAQGMHEATVLAIQAGALE